MIVHDAAHLLTHHVVETEVNKDSATELKPWSLCAFSPLLFFVIKLPGSSFLGSLTLLLLLGLLLSSASFLLHGCQSFGLRSLFQGIFGHGLLFRL